MDFPCESNQEIALYLYRQLRAEQGSIFYVRLSARGPGHVMRNTKKYQLIISHMIMDPNISSSQN